MTAKELLLKEAVDWSERDAEIALRAVEVDEWGNVSDFARASSAATFKRLDKEEAAAGFSWDNYRWS